MSYGICAEFYKALPLFIKGNVLYFKFLPNLSGFSYNVVQSGKTIEFLKSPCLVRDRKALEANSVWNENKESFFNGSFLMRLDDTLIFCPSKVWSPSVDAAFIYNKMLIEDIVLSSDSVFDIGCGTGVVSLALAKKLSNIKNIIAEDTSSLALAAFSINAHINDLEINYKAGTPGSHVCPLADITVTTPFYFPVEKNSLLTPDEEIDKAIADTAYMIRRAIDTAKKAAYFIYSSVTESQVRDMVKDEWDVLDEIVVPFSLGDNVGNAKVVGVALAKGMLKKNETGQFPYSHTIYIGRKLKQ